MRAQLKETLNSGADSDGRDSLYTSKRNKSCLFHSNSVRSKPNLGYTSRPCEKSCFLLALKSKQRRAWSMASRHTLMTNDTVQNKQVSRSLPISRKGKVTSLCSAPKINVLFFIRLAVLTCYCWRAIRKATDRFYDFLDALRELCLNVLYY